MKSLINKTLNNKQSIFNRISFPKPNQKPNKLSKSLLFQLTKRPKTQYSFDSKTKQKYVEMYEESINPSTREKFWDKQASEIDWFEKYPTVLDSTNPPFYRWFPGGKLNVAHNCIDRHIQSGLGNQLALIWNSAYLNKERTFTYSQLLEKVSRVSAFMTEQGVKPGDTVLIYMPMIPEAVFIMLACMRIGAIHNVVFGGFAASELAVRIDHSEPKLIATASCGIEPRKLIHYFPILKEALRLSNRKDLKILNVQREDVYVEEDLSGYNVFDYNKEVSLRKESKLVDPIPVESSQAMYLIYTSGTTGSPKGIMRDVGGTLVAQNFAIKTMMDFHKGDVIFCTSDIGWIVGHVFIVYAPLLRGGTTVMFEGKPVGTPDAGKFWEIADRYNAKTMFTSPTALRAIKKADPEYEYMGKYKMKSLESIHFAGERCDPNTFTWLEHGMKGKYLNDNWWQTETGWPMCSNNLGVHFFHHSPGTAGRPFPGYNLKIWDEHSQKISEEREEFGLIYCELPMPPCFMFNLWKNEKKYLEYFTPDYKYYITGDAGIIDNEGNLSIMSRVDDVINVAGHRLSTGRIEEVILHVPGVAECAVVSIHDELKSELPFAFVVFNSNVKDKAGEIKAIMETVVREIGAISRLKGVLEVKALPKTRSAKILRGVMKNMLNGKEYKVPSTIEDASVIEELENRIKESSII